MHTYSLTAVRATILCERICNAAAEVRAAREAVNEKLATLDEKLATLDATIQTTMAEVLISVPGAVAVANNET
jgi:hypothetical protein